MENKIQRKTLTDEEILAEAKVLKEMGFDHVLIVTGESPKNVGIPYIKNSIRLLRKHFSQISIEVQPLEQEEREDLYKLRVQEEDLPPTLFAFSLMWFLHCIHSLCWFYPGKQILCSKIDIDKAY